MAVDVTATYAASIKFGALGAVACTLRRQAAQVDRRVLYVGAIGHVVTGCNTDKEAAEYYQEAKSIMQDCGFKLRCWASNIKELIEQASN